jgi:hypothetical protein
MKTFLSDGDIKAKMMLLSWNNFLISLIYFVVVKYDYDEGPRRISFTSLFVAERKRKTQKEEFSQLVCMNVGRCSLGIIPRSFAECLLMRSSIQNIIQVWF